MGQATPAPPYITVNGEELVSVPRLHYHRYPITGLELSKHIGKALTTFSKLIKRVWDNKHLTIPTNINVYKACVISTVLYGSESWSTYSTQEWNLQLFHLMCLHRTLELHGRTKCETAMFSQELVFHPCFTLLHQHCLCWLGHIPRMEDGHIPKDLLYLQVHHWG